MSDNLSFLTNKSCHGGDGLDRRKRSRQTVASEFEMVVTAKNDPGNLWIYLSFRNKEDYSFFKIRQHGS